MFRNLPKNSLTISGLIEECNLEKREGWQQTTKLLESTLDFLSSTSPHFQENREQWNNEKIASILHAAAQSLAVHDNILKNGSKKDKEIYGYCKATIEKRLELLRENEDKIYSYYKNNANPLKNILSADHTPQRKLK